MERRSFLLGGASGIPKGGIARLDCRDDRKTFLTEDVFTLYHIRL
jgi:hypothetical protein